MGHLHVLLPDVVELLPELQLLGRSANGESLH